MGKRYYCDYCDRSFIDDVESRKKHLNSLSHIQNRRLHYNAERDLKTLIEEESKKDFCKKLLNSGYCAFGDACYFTHYSKQQLEEFTLEVKRHEKSKVDEIVLPSVDDWLKKRLSNPNEEVVEMEHKKPSIMELCSIPVLPPSLQPVQLPLMKIPEFDTWG